MQSSRLYCMLSFLFLFWLVCGPPRPLLNGMVTCVLYSSDGRTRTTRIGFHQAAISLFFFPASCYVSPRTSSQRGRRKEKMCNTSGGGRAMRRRSRHRSTVRRAPGPKRCRWPTVKNSCSHSRRWCDHSRSAALGGEGKKKKKKKKEKKQSKAKQSKAKQRKKNGKKKKRRMNKKAKQLSTRGQWPSSCGSTMSPAMSAAAMKNRMLFTRFRRTPWPREYAIPR